MSSNTDPILKIELKQQPNGEPQLVLTAQIPRLPNDDKFRKLIAQRLGTLLAEISAAYIHMGGSGLKLDDVEIKIIRPVSGNESDECKQ